MVCELRHRFSSVIEGCPMPVAVAGGPKIESELDFLRMVRRAVNTGARGVAIGRNVFQHQDPILMTKSICSVVHGGFSADEASMISSQTEAEAAKLIH